MKTSVPAKKDGWSQRLPDKKTAMKNPSGDAHSFIVDETGTVHEQDLDEVRGTPDQPPHAKAQDPQDALDPAEDSEVEQNKEEEKVENCQPPNSLPRPSVRARKTPVWMT